MKKERIGLFLFILTIFCIVVSGRVLAEERNIYVGDLIELRISSENITADELRDKFREFEIVDMQENGTGFIIRLRSFETGERKVRLGDKEIIIVIKSTLEDIKRNGVFEGGSHIESAGFSVRGQYALLILPLTALGTGGILLWRYLKTRRSTSLSPYQCFMRQTDEIAWGSRDFFVKLTYYFKVYVEAKFSCRIRGKTSTEIMREISGLPELEESLTEIRSWLNESDRIKFSGSLVSMEKKQKLHEALVELVRKIEQNKKESI